MSEAQGTRKRAKGIPRDELHQQYPSLSSLSGPSSTASRRAWIAVFNLRPDAMHNLIADYIKQVYATPGRIGQRPMPSEEQVDFDGLVYGEQNDLPIGEVLRKIVPISERAFSEQIPMSRRTYQRLLANQYDPDVNEIRAIARILKRSPTFFVEYRKAMVVAAILNLLDERPGMATTLYRHYLEVRMKST